MIAYRPLGCIRERAAATDTNPQSSVHLAVMSAAQPDQGWPVGVLEVPGQLSSTPRKISHCPASVLVKQW
jgi:hypothetical protein